tara:strand:- start:939 stop:1163 length:225 start_codon:yes stop_codon:yes gene_type:complete
MQQQGKKIKSFNLIKPGSIYRFGVNANADSYKNKIVMILEINLKQSLISYQYLFNKHHFRVDKDYFLKYFERVY